MALFLFFLKVLTSNVILNEVKNLCFDGNLTAIGNFCKKGAHYENWRYGRCISPTLEITV
jgi:hypothetical protein